VAKASEAAAAAAVQRPSGANKAVQGLEGELWRICTPIRKPGVKNWDAVNQWLWREEILDAAADPPEKMPGLPAARLEKVIQEAAKKI
jgi:hypothetical protein